MTDDLLDRATELDGPGAIVSHAEVLDLHQRGVTHPVAIGDTLACSSSTARRLLRNLDRAGLL